MNDKTKLSEEDGRIIINTANKLGESEQVKDCYFSIYEKDNKFYLTLQDSNDNVWEITKEQIEEYI